TTQKHNTKTRAGCRQKGIAMGVLPDSRIQQIEWFEQRLAAWMSNTAAIGLTPAQVSQLQGELAAARADYMTAQQARNDSKSATVGFHASSDTLVDDGRDLIKTIKAFAEATNDPNVYVLADVPPPAPPGVVPPPGTPFDFRVSLLQDGAIELGWKCNNPTGGGGTVYEIKRSEAGGPMAFINNTGAKSFVDNTVPANSGPVTYQITAVRSTLSGNPAQFTVQFGAGGTNQNNNADSGDGELGIAA
ncbi:hypothetical protein MNBD_PLANCTO03-464, partial [hydrothermal vent metagenome]